MGEANRYRARFFQSHPIRCFCGGKAEAKEIEHIPPRFMFLNKHRPSGFEFPTCEPCNRASRKTDTVVSFLAKFGSLRNLSETYQKDFDIALKGLFRHCPETYEEIIHGRAGQKLNEKKFKQQYGIESRIVAVGPKQKEHINLFGLKLTLAAYYYLTGRIANYDAKVSVYFHTSLNIMEDTVPKELNFLGDFHTMKQGSWNVRDQFIYRYASTDNQQNVVFQFVLHQNLILSTFIFDEPVHHDKLNKKQSFLTIADLKAVAESPQYYLPSLSGSFTLGPQKEYMG